MGVNSLGVISSPAMNSITMAPMSPSTFSSPSMLSRFSPSYTRNAPSANGPIIMPARSSPSTMGSFSLRKSSAISFAANSSMPTPIMVWMNSASAAMPLRGASRDHI